ncbi:hypothetical protein [uncultured Roseibium sp.]|uniref:hypothetical protein n=1 Tax=uncultured Roseibium sp. TaxID=1936171 RepID=UPI002604FF2E|nr:hypothetical protein [uncultured Roseibium sp.]
MSDNLLFGYSVEEHDGKLVITLDGQMAVPIIKDLAARSWPNGNGLSSMAALFPFSLLASNAVDLINPSEEKENSQDSMSIEDIFGQGFDKNLSEFEDQIDRYRSLLAAAGGDGQESETDARDAASAARLKKTAAKS